MGALDPDPWGYHVHDCQDAALLLLARDVIGGLAHYAFHGLAHHQSTMLAHLGAAVPTPEAEAEASEPG